MGAPTVTPLVVKPKALACPNCGGPVELRGFSHTLSVVCPQCLTVLDATNPQLAILTTFQGQQRIEPQIPLGSRGKLEGTDWEVIGFQVREVTTEDARYGWSEYLLFNPYKGFRYLSEYNGHWNFIRVLSALPKKSKLGSRFAVVYQGRTYKHFDKAPATTSYVLGEFPWQVTVGEFARVDDFISPPYMLSSETMSGEVSWSLGEYYTGQQIWQAFKLPGRPYPAVGVFANQTSPYKGTVGSAWRMCLWLLVALTALMFYFMITAARQEVFRQSYTFAPGIPPTTETYPHGIGADLQNSWTKPVPKPPPYEPAFVTGDFELKGRPSNLEIATRTNLSNDWVYFHFALINETTGQAKDFGREVSNYTDEGSPNDSVILPAVPAGKYYLRVEPEKTARSRPVNYELIIRRDVPRYSWFFVAAILLLIPPVIVTFRTLSFESARWRESDYGSAGGNA